MRNPDPSESLSSLIRSERLKLEWTQQKLADVAGVSRKHISEVERGIRNTSMVTTKKIMSALGIDSVDLGEFVIDAGFDRSESVNLRQIEALLDRAFADLDSARQLLKRRRQ